MSRVPVASTLALAVMIAATCAALAPEAWSQRNDRQTATRTLQGQVTDGSNQPLPDAVVYLKNGKDLSVKTYIADREGNYRFNALSSNADYEVYAEHKGQRSEPRNLSSFDSRKLVTINLRMR